MATFNPQTMARGQFVQAQAGLPPAQSPPSGTFIPGTKVQVGSHRVIIDRYLSEGGFAHVYVVTLPKSVDGQEKGVLKRVAVPDKEHLAHMRNEVETMKKLRGHKQIVKYIDSHASSLKSGGYEVFLLMEFCQGGGLIDFMNTRLQNRLTEPEILKIFTDVAEGVACMHYLKPPLLHRDLKVENVLISTESSRRVFKICDFGSAAPPRPAATSAAEGRLVEDDVQRHTTMQYRSPEMVDVYRKQPINEKSDIWALGVFLYKLCYYTTPFEEVGQMAILNASFKYPGYPRFSDQLKLLIASMLREQPSQRPNIYQVLQKACQMDGRPLKIRDIYSDRTHSEARKTEVLPEPVETAAAAGAMLSPPAQSQAQTIPDIAPMRRGRPSRPVSNHNSARPSPSPLRMVEGSDPFSQLDGKKGLEGDELSHKFPKLDQFSLLSETGSKFAFDSEQQKRLEKADLDLSQRVTHALADDAFARPASPPKPKPAVSQKSDLAKASMLAEKHTQTDDARSKQSLSVTSTNKPVMVSTGTMTSPPSSATTPNLVSDRQIYRFPPNDKVPSSNISLTKSNSALGPTPSSARPQVISNKSGSRLASLLKEDAARSQQSKENTHLPASSRPSMEGRRPSMADLDNDLSRSKSLDLRVRPTSVNMGSGPTHIRDQEIKKTGVKSASNIVDAESAVIDSDTKITSDMDFLRAREEEEKERTRMMKRNSSGSRHSKRSSLPSMAITGTRNLFSGRFGDAFKRFESHEDQDGENSNTNKEQPEILTPIAGSEATDLSDDRPGLEETEDLSPEMRRELEKRQLEAEERRVASAAAEYRQRTGNRSGGPSQPSAKATMIQHRVQSLLHDSDRPVQKTATGYGHYTELEEPRTWQGPTKSATFNEPIASQIRAEPPVSSSESRSLPTPAPASKPPRLQRPAAPPKPKVLQSNRHDLYSQRGDTTAAANGEPDIIPTDNWEERFSRRYPSLSHLEMVETDIDIPQPKTKEI